MKRCGREWPSHRPTVIGLGGFMKAISGIALGIACSTFSVAASSATEAHTRACVDEFIAEELNNRPAEVRIDRAPDFPMPLVLLSEVPMQLKAVERASGRTI